MSSPRTQLYQEIREPELQSLTYPIVVELVEFKRKDLPMMIYTTHIRLWKKGRITSVLEINGNGGPDCNRSRAKRAIADHSATIELHKKSFKRTPHGQSWAFKDIPGQLLETLDELAEAVYKPHAIYLQLLRGLIV